MFLFLLTQGSGYHYCTASSNKDWTQVLRRFKSCLGCVRDSRWWGSLRMVIAGYKAKRLSLVNHTTKTIHHHHHHHHHQILILEFENCTCFCGYSIIVTIFLTKTESRTKKIFNTAFTPLLWVRVLFCWKMLIFCKKNIGISKIMKALVFKGIFWVIWNFKQC